MAALLRPFGMCAEFLNPKVVTDLLAPGMEKAIKFIQNLEEKDLKEKVNIGEGGAGGGGGLTDLLAPGMEKAIKFIQNLEEKDLKEKVNIRAWGVGGG